MLFTLRRRVSLWRFNRSARAVLETPPVRSHPDGAVTIVTQVYPPDLIMYLVAIKSFTRFVRPRSVVVVGDRLTEQDKSLIRSHVLSVEILDIQEIDAQDMPRGGCWERLITIIGKATRDYTIQLDADTITQSAPQEVLDCIGENRSFTLGTSMGRSLISVDDASAAVSKLASPDAHVQIAAEVALRDTAPRSALYVRGNAAFAGFAKGAYSIDLLRTFSKQMENLLGRNKWHEWGSEQVASNYLIANSQDPCVLPFDRYRYYQPGAAIDSCPFVHFMGTYRFAGGAYRRLARRSIRAQLVG